MSAFENEMLSKAALTYLTLEKALVEASSRSSLYGIQYAKRFILLYRRSDSKPFAKLTFVDDESPIELAFFPFGDGTLHQIVGKSGTDEIELDGNLVVEVAEFAKSLMLSPSRSTVFRFSE